MRLSSILSLLVLGAAPAHAGEVYKCTNASGGIAYQDVPCASGDAETTVRMSTQPAAPAPGDSVEAVQRAQDGPSQQAAPAPAGNTSKDPPAMWLCTRPEDGKQYMTSDSSPPTRMVPSGILGQPGKSVGTAFGKGNMSAPAPGVRRIAPAPAAADAAATDYVAVQDQCEPATREATCSYLQGEYDKLHEKIKHAFKDDRAVLEPQLYALDRQMDGC